MPNIEISTVLLAPTPHYSGTPGVSFALRPCTTHSIIEKWNGTVWEDWTVAGGDASVVTFTPEGTIAASTVQGAISELDSEIPARIASQITALGDGAPLLLDTLNELAAALGDDPNFATTVTTALGTKVDAEGVRDTIATALVAGANVTITPDDAGDTITIAASPSSTDAEVVRDTVAAALVPGTRVTITPNDAGDTITIAVPVISTSLTVAVTDESSTVATGNAQVTFRMPHAMTLTGIRASLSTASTSGTVAVDVNEGGATILSTKVYVEANERSSLTATTQPVISDTALADDAEITIDVDAAGTGATGLKVTLLGTRSA